MADKKPAPKPEGIDFIAGFFFVFLIFLFLNSLISNYFFKSDSIELSGTSEQIANQENLETTEQSFWNKILPQPKIKLGENVANKKEVEVRNIPAGSILGTQKKGQLAIIMEGPISKFGVNWWRVDYAQAPSGWVSEGDLTAFVFWSNIINFFPWFFGSLQKLLILIGIIALVLIVIVNLKMKSVRKMVLEKNNLLKENKAGQNFLEKKEEMKKENIEDDVENDLVIPGLPVGPKPPVQDVGNRRWKEIQNLINSHNLNDWRQAIIEADIILDEMLDKMGYRGESVGDKLKQIESSDFLTLNQAWEAHKVRNQIAHKGNRYVLSKDEAERVIGLYEQIFREFFYI
jgi:hypothetical protein